MNTPAPTTDPYGQPVAPSRRWPLLGIIAVLVVGAAAMAAWRLLGAGPEQHLQQARKALAQGDARTSVIQAKNFLAERPESGEGRFVLGRALLALGDARGASAELDRAAKAGYDEVQVVPALAAAMLEEGRARDVVARFSDRSLPDAAGNADLLTQLARAQRELGNPERARQSIQAALKLAPQHQGAQAMEVRLQADAGDAPSALARATEMATRADAPVEVRLLRADLLMRQSKDRLPEALEEYRKAVLQQPRSLEAHSGLIGAMLRQGDTKAAREQVVAARKVLPGVPQVVYLDGLSAFLAGDMARAKEMVDQLNKQVEPTPATQTLSGMVNARLGQTTLAEGQLTAAIAAEPRSAAARLELAALYLRSGRPERSIEILKPLEGETQDSGFWMLMGQANARLGDFKNAEDAFAKARKASPEDVKVRAEAAKAQIALGRSELGLKELEAAAKSDLTGVDLDLALVAAHMKGGRVAQALEALAAAEKKSPSNSDLTYIKGQVLLQNGDRSGARTTFEEALKRDPKSFRSAGALALLDQAEGRPQDARRRMEALSKALPQSAPIRLTLADSVLRSDGSIAEVRTLIDEAVRLDPKDAVAWRTAIGIQKMLGRSGETLARAQAAVSAIPDDPALLGELAAAMAVMGNPVQALTNYRKVTQLAPLSAEAHLKLAIALGATGNVDGARGPLARALELAPGDPGVVRTAMAMALSDRQPDKARALVKSLQVRNADDPAGWDLEAELESQLGRHPMAAAAAATALKKGSVTQRAIILHKSLLAAGDKEGARALEQRWLQTATKDTQFLIYLADLDRASGRPADAQARLRQALVLEPANPIVLNNLADLLIGSQPAEAVTLAKRATATTPHLPFTWQTLAEAQAATGKVKDAVASQRRAVELQPEDLAIQFGLGRHLMADGQPDQAREAFRRASVDSAPEAIRNAAKEQLRKLGA